MKSMSTETKVGIFVIIGIIILAYFTVRVGQITVREKGYEVYTLLDTAAGLDKNSPVRIAGVDVGKVESVSLEGDRARVVIRLPNRVKIPEGSKVYVKSSGLLGEKYLEIVPPQEGTTPRAASDQTEKGSREGTLEPLSGAGRGTAFAQERPRGKAEEKRPAARYIEPGAYIPQGGPAVDVDRVLTQLSSIGEDFKGVARSLNETLGGPQGEANLKAIVTGTRETVANLQDITRTIDRGEGTLGKLVKDERLYAEMRNTVSNLQDITQTIDRGEGTLGKLVKDDRLYRDMKETASNLNQVTQAIEKGEGTLGKLVKDDTLYVQTKETMTEAKNMMANLNKLSESVEKGEGTLGKLAKDDALYVETAQTMKSARETLVSLNQVSKDIESGKGTLGKLIKDEALYEDTRRAVKSVQKAADGVAEVTPVTVLGIILSNVLR